MENRIFTDLKEQILFRHYEKEYFTVFSKGQKYA